MRRKNAWCMRTGRWVERSEGTCGNHDILLCECIFPLKYHSGVACGLRFSCRVVQLLAGKLIKIFEHAIEVVFGTVQKQENQSIIVVFWVGTNLNKTHFFWKTYVFVLSYIR